MSQHAGDRPLSHEVRLRLPLPVVIPLGALLAIAAVTFGMSRILLSVPKEIAVVIALAIGANILIACAFVALRPESARRSWSELLIVAAYPLVIGVVIASLGLGHGDSAGEAEHAGAEAAAAAGAAAVSAANVAFSTDTIELKAKTEETIPFVNDDSAEHNIAIYEDDSATKELFKGEIIPGGQETTYTIPPLAKGEYYFQCDVHPGMNGTVTVQ
ncbi:MAG: cupredoxin domain-containing protein [Actinomycetota bacterium]|nr:cupredoxin domain-containing protein [Actinomycetota bacterium]